MRLLMTVLIYFKGLIKTNRLQLLWNLGIGPPQWFGHLSVKATLSQSQIIPIVISRISGRSYWLFINMTLLKT